MKSTLKLIAVAVVAALFTVPMFAQEAAPAESPECEKAKTESYVKWLDNYKKGPEQQKIAYEAGKEFLTKCTDATDAYVKAVNKWVPQYEEAVVKFERRKKFEAAGKALDAMQGTKDYAPLFAAGKELVTAEPENLPVLLVLANVGVLNSIAGASTNKSLDPDAISFTKRALALVEAGKGTPEEFKAISAANKEEAIIGLNYRLGVLNRNTAPGETTTQLLKVAQSNSPLKSEPSLYYYLAQAYTDSDYKKLLAEYQQKFPEGQPVPDERKAEYDQYQLRLEQSIDRIIDAYARTAALITKTDAASVDFKKSVMATLTNLYKQRHEGKEDGLNEFIAGSATRRLPLPSDPLPTPAPTTSEATPMTPTTTPTPKP